jgi:hypothetical protein
MDGINFVWWPLDFRNAILYSSKNNNHSQRQHPQKNLSQKALYQYNIMFVSKLIYYDENNILPNAH